MTIHFGLSSFLLASPFSDQDQAAFVRTAAFGYDIIEVCVEDPNLITADAVRRHATEAGLQVSICGAFGPGRDLSSTDSDERRQAQAYLRTCIDLAADVGSPHVAGPMYAVTGQARLLEPDERHAQFRRAAVGIAEAAEYATSRGIRLAIEPLNRFETDVVNTVEQGLELCELVGSPDVGLLLDTFHMNIEEKNFGDAIRAAGSRVFHVQIAENDRGVPGSGHVPWNEVFAALADISYRGQIVVESFLPTVREIARAVSLWRPVASSMDEIASGGLDLLRRHIPRRPHE